MPDSPPLLSVLIPVYNERATLEEILRRVRAISLDLEMIVVDNVSDDGTREYLQSLLESGDAGGAESSSRLRVVFQTQNKGKGASVRRALGLARGQWVIVQDADLEYDPRDFQKLLDLAKRRRLDAVFGTRLAPGSATRREQPRTAFFYGRVGLTLFYRVLYGAPLDDVATCYKLLRRPFALSLGLTCDGFDLDFEIAAKVARARKHGARVGQTPISYHPRTELEGKKIRVVRDGVRAAWALLRFRF
ncbi:undecaprenyl-phosphate mannosyltransferase [Abditibacteriota bacterium]|nr:undecaprenyl-phosphate mannosyltransferase [Abditibacteriota bacterium]